MVAVGDTLNGRHRLDRQVGRGGFARVFLSTDLTLRRQVAIKVLNPDLAGDPTFLSRFEREAQSAAKLEHPNILPVYDFGHDADTAYLVMPYVAGGTLQERLATSGKLALPEAAAYLRQAASALDYAHARNIVHRDVKPQNLLLRDDGHLLLADFGIAKVLQETQASSSSGVVGTLAYMAPEQFEGQASPASDVYALGCVLFELVTGKPPYTGPTQQVIHGHLHVAVPSVVDRSGGRMPEELQGVLDTALAKRPGDRYPSAGALAGAVRAVAEGYPRDGVASAPSGAVTIPVSPPTSDGNVPILPSPSHAVAPPAPTQGKRALARPTSLIAIVLVVLALSVATTVGRAALRASGGPPTATVELAGAGASSTATVAQSAALPPQATTLPTQTATVLPSVAPTPMATVAPTLTPMTVPTATRTISPTLAPTVPLPPPTPTVQIPRSSAATLVGHTGKVRLVAWSPDGRILASASNLPDAAVRLWAADGTSLAVLTGHTDAVTALAWSPDGRTLASGSIDGTVRLWTADGTPIAVLRGHADTVIALAWSPDGRILASASYDNTVRLWAADGTLLKALTGHADDVLAFAWSPDGRVLASGSADHTVRLWAADGTLIAVLTGHSEEVEAVKWSPDSRILASGDQVGTVRLWAADGTPLKVLTGHAVTATVWRLAWSPDGRTLASGATDNTVRLWAVDGTLIATLTGHSSWIYALAWSPDGRVLASGSGDHTVRLWAADGTFLAVLRGHTDAVWGLVWSPDGTILASASPDTTVRLWR